MHKACTARCRILLVACIALVAAALPVAGCADSPDIGSGPNIYTTTSPGGHLRIMAVDQELTRLAQAGELDLDNLPQGRRVYYGTSEDAAGTDVPYVVKSDFFFTQMDVFYAEVSEGADGSFEVFFQLNDESGLNSSGKLMQLTAEALTASQQDGGTASLAVIHEDEVLALVTLVEPLVSGGIQVGGLTQEEADEVVLYFPDRAYRFPEEGRTSKWDQ